MAWYYDVVGSMPEFQLLIHDVQGLNLGHDAGA